MEAMGELMDSIKVNENDDANTALIKIKGSLNGESYRSFRSGRRSA